ncbi:uncharacterized protein LOC115216635 isoform X2 [Argonauta hians]
MELQTCPPPESPTRESSGSKSSESLEESSPSVSALAECPDCPDTVLEPSDNGDDACNTEDKELALSISEELIEPTDPTISVSETFLEDMETIGSLDDLTEAVAMTQEFPESNTEDGAFYLRDNFTCQAPEEESTTEPAVLALVESLETAGEISLGVLDIPSAMEIPFSQTLQEAGTIMDGPFMTTSEHQLYVECRKSVVMEPHGPVEMDSVTMKSIESKLIQDDNSSLSSDTMVKVNESSEWAEGRMQMLATSPFGSNRSSVSEAMDDMKSRCKDAKLMAAPYREFLNKEDIKIPEIREATRAFDSLDALMAKQTACLEVISQISALEDTVQNTALAIDTKSVELANSEVGAHVSERSSHGNNTLLMATSQNCNLAVRNNWKWIGTMLECSQVHFHNAADFHQFFHDAQEAEYWMKNTLSTIHLSFDRSKLQGDMTDVQSIKQEIRDVLLAYTQWQGKIDTLFDRAKNIVPVSQRLKPVEDYRAVTSLADYRTNDIDFIEGESLTLLNNSDRKIWKVSNTRGQTALVPAVLILIPGPYPEALDLAIKLRVQLLSLWTASVKRLGYQLISFMLLVIKDYSEDEIKEFLKLTPSQQQELIALMKYIEDSLMKNWTDYKDFEEMQDRMARIKFTLEEKTNAPRSITGGDQQSVIIQFNALKDLLGKYEDFWAYWETYKVIVELLKQPKFLLVCDKWEQLRFVSTAHFVRFWDTNLDVDTDGKVDQVDQSVVNKSLALHETPREDMISSDYTVSTEKEETETEQVLTSIEEEERTFYMKEVLDPLTNNMISFQDAVMRGIIDQVNIAYVNPYTRESMPIKQAINDGLIKLEWTTRNKIREEKRSFGLITIKTTRDSRPYNIMQVIDPSTNKPISTTDAVKKGILDIKNSVYVKSADEHIPVPEAIDMGKIIIEYTGKDTAPEVVSKTYKVHSIVDQRKKDRVPFAEALAQGLFDKENGLYINNVTGAKIPVGEAIMLGFIKARLVTDVNKLDVNPENRVVIERMQGVREKLNKGMRVVNAMKAGLKPGLFSSKS